MIGRINRIFRRIKKPKLQSAVSVSLQKTYDPTNSYLITPRLLELYKDELRSICFDFYKSMMPEVRLPDIEDAVDSFCRIYKNKPFVDNSGGSGYHNLFWLYTFVFLKEPSVIVESGTWKGMSSWMMRQASKDARVYCFDLSFKRLQYRDEGFNYIENDWKRYNFKNELTTDGLCFFDDHVNQVERVLEAYDKGFRTLIFDDASPAHKVYTFGLPPLPTIPMLFDERLSEEIEMEWVFRGKKTSFRYDPNDQRVRRARELIENYRFFPDVSLISQFDKNRFLAVVNLKK